MKKILALLILISAITSCGKGSGTDEPIDTYEEDTISIVRSWSIVDEQNKVRYSYGTKRKGKDKECFWFSKYIDSGELIWETILSDNYNKGRAWNPLFLNDEKILVSNIRGGNSIEEGFNFTNNDADIILLSSQDGTIIKKIDNAFYTDIITFENFFFTTIADKELAMNSNITLVSYQIDNNGNLLNQGNELYYPDYSRISSVKRKPIIPDGQTKWISDTAFIHMDAEKIERGNIFEKIPRWTHKTNIFSLTNEADMALIIDGDSVNASYKLAEIDTTFRLSCATGKTATATLPLDTMALSPFNISLKISTLTSLPGGYYSGFFTFTITNTSDETINLSEIEIIDGNYNQIAKMDESILGILNKDESKSYNANLYDIYIPILVIKYQYKGETKTYFYNFFQNNI